jgi:competence protein ComEC
VSIGGTGLVLTYAGIAAVTLLCMYLAQIGRLGTALRASGFACAVLLLPFVLPAEGPGAGAPAGLRVEVLDVGQGDAILLRPAGAPAVLVDGGPPGAGLARKLEEAGVESLGAAVVTHPQSDHMGGVEELLGDVPIHRLLFARPARRLLGTALEAGVEPQRIAAGRELRSGALRLRVLWPPPELLTGSVPDQDPNRLSLVIEARWRHFTMLLTGDAEAEAAPIETGPVDVLKVAHHGSEDAGLGALLDRAQPRRHGVPTLRTDEEGTIVIDVGGRSFSVDG